MSDWMVDETPDGDKLRFWNGDLGYEVQVIALNQTGGFQINIEWYEDEGTCGPQVLKRSADAYAHGRNLEVLREFILRGVREHFIKDNARLYDLVRSIKYQALGLGDFEDAKDSPLAQWICTKISDEDCGWK